MKKLVFHRYVLQKGEVYKERIIFSYIHLAIFFTINSPKKPNPNQKKPTKQKNPKSTNHHQSETLKSPLSATQWILIFSTQ